MTTSTTNKIVCQAGLLLAVALGVAACSGDGRPFQEAVEANQLDLASLTIRAPAGFVTDPELVVNPGDQISFLVGAQNSSGTPITLSANDRRWSVSEPAFASIDDNGNFTAIADVPEVFVRLRIGSSTASFPVKINTSSVTPDITITGLDSLERCRPDEYSATGKFEDGSIRGLFNVNWIIEPPQSGFTGMAEQEGAVLVTGTNAGDINLIADVGGVMSKPVVVKIEDNLESIDITPVDVEILEDATLQLTARGTYRIDEENVVRPIISENVQWSLTNGADPSVATVSNTGIVEGVGLGNTSITVACGDFRVDKNIAVVEPGSTGDDAPLAFEGGSSQTVSISEFDGQIQLRVSIGDTFSTANLPESSDIEWSLQSVSSPGVIRLDPNGLVTLNRTGGATIRATVGEDSAVLVLTIEE